MASSIPIRQIPEGKFVTVSKVRPIGSLQARRHSSGGITLYWRYSFGAQSERVTIGVFDPVAPPKSLSPSTNGGFSVAAAVRAAETMSLEHYESRSEGGRPEQQRKRKAEKAATTAVTLKALLDEYCDYLESLGRRSHRDARSIFRLHVYDAHPDMAEMPASQVTGEDIADIMRHMIKGGIGRTANKLRAFVHAAYTVARKAKSSPAIPQSFKAFRISANPASETEADSSANKADKNPLSLEDLRKYWKAIKGLEGFRGAVLRLHLLTGAQRIEQLVKLPTDEIFTDHIVLLDGKGRPGKPARQHKVPLLKASLQALKNSSPVGTYALSTDGGKTHLAATTLSSWAAAVATEVGIAKFQAKRIRSGVETALAAAGVSREDRGHLQSHGISGVQARHYDDHDYLPRKRRALETLLGLLEPDTNQKRRTDKTRQRSRQSLEPTLAATR